MLDQKYWETAGRLMCILAHHLPEMDFRFEMRWERSIVGGGGFLFLVIPRQKWSGSIFMEWADAERLNGDLGRLADAWIENARNLYGEIINANL